MIGSPVRAAGRTALVTALTLPLMVVQAISLAIGAKAARTLPLNYHRLCCRIFGLRVVARGDVATAGPTLFVANHQSYLDITVLGSLVELSFIAKREVADWPFFGWLAKLQRTVFVARKVSGVAGERDEIARRLGEGGNLLIFAEGTSNDGTHLLPFKSALLSVAERDVGGRALTVQPVSVSYNKLDGMPIGRQWRPLYAWYGDMDLLPHFWTVLGLGLTTVEIVFHPPVSIAELGTRKALAEHCRRAIAAGLSAAKSARPPALPGPAVPGTVAAAGG